MNTRNQKKNYTEKQPKSGVAQNTEFQVTFYIYIYIYKESKLHISLQILVARQTPENHDMPLCNLYFVLDLVHCEGSQSLMPQ